MILEDARQETIPWEIFRGRLLDASQTRAAKAFLSWNVYTREEGARSGEPILSAKWDRDSQQIHIVRGLLCYVWEGYQAEGNVYLSREVTKWVRELVGTVDLEQFGTAEELRDELSGRLFQAVVGLSRLPLTSVEAPLPGFSLGKLGYFYGGTADDTRPMCSARELLERGLREKLSWLEKAKLVELALRAAGPDELPKLVDVFAERWHQAGQTSEDISLLLRTILNEVALSPYTAFVPNLLCFVNLLAEQEDMSVLAQIDFLAHALRQQGRHLTAYDLKTFHHFGANYPDALLLDAVLKEYLRLMERRPALFLDAANEDAASRLQKRLRRRALRQGWLLRRFYEGLPVPDAPTSPGENARVLPPPHVRVPEEQITNPIKRKKILYAGDSLEPYLGANGRQILLQSIADLQHPAELRELGMAVFIDRPLGWHKSPGEPDQTLLFSHEAFSRSIARQRLELLAQKVFPEEYLPWNRYQQALAELPIAGLPAQRWQKMAGRVVSLADASRLTDDFLLLRTTPGAVREFLAQYPLPEVEQLYHNTILQVGPVLIVPTLENVPGVAPNLIIHDHEYRPRLELAVDLSRGYISRGGREYPAAGLRVGGTT